MTAGTLGTWPKDTPSRSAAAKYRSSNHYFGTIARHGPGRTCHSGTKSPEELWFLRVNERKHGGTQRYPRLTFTRGQLGSNRPLLLRSDSFEGLSIVNDVQKDQIARRANAKMKFLRLAVQVHTLMKYKEVSPLFLFSQDWLCLRAIVPGFISVMVLPCLPFRTTLFRTTARRGVHWATRRTSADIGKLRRVSPQGRAAAASPTEASC